MALKQLYRHFEPNPGDFTDEFHTPTDCFIRACVALFNISWDCAFYIAVKMAIKNHCMPNDLENIIEVMSIFDCEYISASDDKNYENGMTVYTFTKNHPEGKYLLLADDHAISCIDGQFIDAWNSRWKHIEDVFKCPDEATIKKVKKQFNSWSFKRKLKDFVKNSIIS